MAIKYSYKKKINNEGIKRERASHSNRRFAISFLLGVCLVLGMIFSGWVRWKQTEIIYRINKVEEKIGDLVEEQKELLLELYQLQAYDRARMIAEKQLGMVNAEPEQIIKVDVTPDPNEEQGQEKEIADQADAGAES